MSFFFFLLIYFEIIRLCSIDDVPTGDIQAITGKPATRFGDFVRDFIKPML
jgi:hypothetical protein